MVNKFCAEQLEAPCHGFPCAIAEGNEVVGFMLQKANEVLADYESILVQCVVANERLQPSLRWKLAKVSSISKIIFESR